MEMMSKAQKQKLSLAAATGPQFPLSGSIIVHYYPPYAQCNSVFGKINSTTNSDWAIVHEGPAALAGVAVQAN